MIPAAIVMKFTRRKNSFVTTPMDYLIFLIAIAIAIMPGFSSVSVHTKLLATKMMILFFSYEVLIQELRGEVGRIGWFTALSLLLLATKSIF